MIYIVFALTNTDTTIRPATLVMKLISPYSCLPSLTPFLQVITEQCVLTCIVFYTTIIFSALYCVCDAEAVKRTLEIQNP